MRHTPVILLALITGCTAQHPKVITTQPPPQPLTPTAETPVTATLWLTPAGNNVHLHLQLHIAPGHHLYAATAGPFTPTAVKLNSPDLLPTAPKQSPDPDAQGHQTGTVEFRQQLHLAPNVAPGSHELACDLTYQACNPELCWPPRTLTLKTSFTVIEKGSP
jgi:hypothetical protein